MQLYFPEAKPCNFFPTSPPNGALPLALLDRSADVGYFLASKPSLAELRALVAPSLLACLERCAARGSPTGGWRPSRRPEARLRRSCAVLKLAQPRGSGPN